jgi:serine/threonine-protein kinase
VFVAYDEELHREVALKEIQKPHAGHADGRSRFLLEAEITGNLEHPGVVPVYGLGRHSDGRPFYTMRFIKGRSLREAIDRFHAAESPNRDPGERRLALRELLGRFVAVCNTVAYAHSRGVLHRDLKPDNVMLGPFGETLVVDWGLAKVIDRTRGDLPAGSAAPELQAAHDPSSTRVGATPDGFGPLLAIHQFATRGDTILGTPAYVSPEQAAGQVETVGPASDVYSLGATLYVLLMGRASVIGSDVADVLEKVIRGEWLPPRQVKKRVPLALDAICCKAMALKPEDRYGSALELAADVEHWLADEPVSAYREPWATRWRRWVQRHRSAVSAATATALTVVLLAGSGVLWLARHQTETRAEKARQEERQRQGVEAALYKLPDLMRQWRWKEAETVLDEADRHLGEAGPADLRARAAQARADLGLAVRLDAIRLRRAAINEGGEFDNKTAERDYAAEFLTSGLGWEGEEAEALAARVQNSAIKDQLVAALDDWIYARIAVTKDPEQAAWLFLAARAADPDPWRDRFRDPKVWRDRAALEGLADELLKDEAKLKAQSPQLLAALGDALLWQGGNAVPLLAEAWHRHPDDCWLNVFRGNALLRAKKWEAAGHFRAALALRPESGGIHYNLGYALRETGQLDEAVREFRTAIDLAPKFVLAHNELGRALYGKNQLDEAIKEWRTAIDLDPKYVWAHNNLGNALHDKKQWDEAIKEFWTAIDLAPKLAAPRYNLGRALAAKGQRDEAIKEWRTAIDLGLRYAPAHYDLGNALRNKGNHEEAIQEYRKAIDLAPNFAQAHGALGGALLQQGRFVEAREATLRCLAHLSGDPPLKKLATQQLQLCDRFIALDEKLPAILEGKQKPTDAERVPLAWICLRPSKQLYAASSRFYAEALQAKPELAKDPATDHRYNAACAAALAGCGKGEDAAKLEEAERARLRQQALQWLKADLDLWAKLTEGDASGARANIQKALRHWQRNSSLAGLRDKDALDNLSESERAACQKLWAEVEALVKKCSE